MGRPRSIDRDAVLDAVQAVVVRDGAARVTLDAVAAEAGISKASVLYDYKTKQALVRALIERRLAAEEERRRQLSVELGKGPDTAIRARIAAVTTRASEEDRAVAMGLCASVAQDAELRQPVRRAFCDLIGEVESTSRHPRGATLALLALEGLMLLEWMDLHDWSDEERQQLLEEIEWLSRQDPPPPTPADPAP